MAFQTGSTLNQFIARKITAPPLSPDSICERLQPLRHSRAPSAATHQIFFLTSLPLCSTIPPSNSSPLPGGMEMTDTISADSQFSGLRPAKGWTTRPAPVPSPPPATDPPVACNRIPLPILSQAGIAYCVPNGTNLSPRDR